jgi:hypothetical protein
MWKSTSETRAGRLQASSYEHKLQGYGISEN